MFTRLLLAVYFIETGLLLVVAPWTIWWRRNFFADLLPWLSAVMDWSATRAGVVAAGGVTFLAGLREAAELTRRWWVRRRGSGDGIGP